MVGRVGAELAERLRDLTLAIYDKAARPRERRGLILADTKFEFGIVDERIVLADEVLTPDSSRFWPRRHLQARRPAALLRQAVCARLSGTIHWNKQAPAPALPPEVVARTQEKYLEAFRLLTGASLSL